MKKQTLLFVLRWVLNALVLWVVIKVLGTGYDDKFVTSGLWSFFWAGFIFSVFNSLVKPWLFVVSFPMIILTLGLFTLILNGILVYVSMKIVPGVPLSFGNSILAGILLSLVNYIVSVLFEVRGRIRRSA